MDRREVARKTGVSRRFDMAVSVGGYLVITDVGTSYDATGPSKGLGFVEFYMDNIDTIVFSLRVNKVGTGTQNWQLWNGTDSTQVTVISDAGATGDKDLTTTVTGLALTGLKRLRVRVNSTVGTDDPIYYGSSLILRKTTP